MKSLVLGGGVGLGMTLSSGDESGTNPWGLLVSQWTRGSPLGSGRVLGVGLGMVPVPTLGCTWGVV